jgi:hypothetical protein
MRALDRDFQLLQGACMYPDRHLEREIRISLPVIALPLYQASRPFPSTLFTYNTLSDTVCLCKEAGAAD